MAQMLILTGSPQAGDLVVFQDIPLSTELLPGDLHTKIVGQDGLKATQRAGVLDKQPGIEEQRPILH
jgi:hypothetical protein